MPFARTFPTTAPKGGCLVSVAEGADSLPGYFSGYGNSRPTASLASW
jgi:hypothetical protein